VRLLLAALMAVASLPPPLLLLHPVHWHRAIAPRHCHVPPPGLGRVSRIAAG
jgi:hypothetical protein